MTPTNNLKRLGVILITDNREKNTTDRSFVIDYRCSAFKCIFYLTKKLKLIP